MIYTCLDDRMSVIYQMLKKNERLKNITYNVLRNSSIVKVVQAERRWSLPSFIGDSTQLKRKSSMLLFFYTTCSCFDSVKSFRWVMVYWEITQICLREWFSISSIKFHITFQIYWSLFRQKKCWFLLLRSRKLN